MSVQSLVPNSWQDALLKTIVWKPGTSAQDVVPKHQVDVEMLDLIFKTHIEN